MSKIDRGILLFGATGQVGQALLDLLGDDGPVVGLDRTAVDLTDPDAVRASIRQHQPRVIINAAAYTDVEGAERELALAEVVNAIAPGVMAEEAEACGAAMVHYSTDYVFDGTKPTAYVETDEPSPLSVYGRTKLAGELAVASACEHHVILRTSWVFGVNGKNFVRTILRLAAERDHLRVVADQRGAPTSAVLIADVTASIVRNVQEGSSRLPWGLYHLTASGAVSWADLARYVLAAAERMGATLRIGADDVESITSAEFGARAPRPLNSCLDTSKVRTTLSIPLPDWRDGVDATLPHLLQSVGT